MTLEQKKRIACAELDGWKKHNLMGGYVKENKHVYILPPYATSLDTIVPVVIKWCGEDINKWALFTNQLDCKVEGVFVFSSCVKSCFKSSPSQILDTLLLAAGKMPVE